MKLNLQSSNLVSIKNLVYEEIKNSILKSELQPGQLLSEQELASKLGVSRTPVRESLINLSYDGLVKVYPQRGSVVSYIDREKVFQAQFIRESLEVETIRKLVQVISDEQIHKLKQNINMQKAMLENSDYEGFYQLDEEFHGNMAVFCGYPRVWEVIKREKVQLDRVRLLTLPDNQLISNLITQHQEILDYLEERDTEKVVSAVRNHTRRVLNTLEEISKKKEHYFS
ncbi:GntR family transcriptional regulator [Terrihalobacillus insolitus]|uniref:GntR family transcriptional regulator n=1 Tax=Terrihalobacillus insolitus TaxID=2950438 RepID=UPI0023406161|nr:GntR family transcriptional regulator [Terrihalobacillus insolitus]MDC3415149.1 GntR family transcriptional regulator [Terrihalobacillus insolitus]